MMLGCIADDFTGASDLANTLARGGMRTELLVGTPTGPSGCEAGVIALKTRSALVETAVERSLKALAWLRAQGCDQILFKYCSTFDSTPEGNIGPVCDALLDALGAASAIVCPAFPRTGRLVFQGHLFVNGKLLSESGMERHPLTPMTDPDIRRWLGRQTRSPVGSAPLEIVRQGPDALRARITHEAREGRRLIVVDAIEDVDLHTIGAAAFDHPLVTGASGVAIALPHNFRQSGRLSGDGARWTGVEGPGLALSGSCSQASRAQVARHRSDHPGFAVAPQDVLEGRLTVAHVLDWITPRLDVEPIVYSTADPETVATIQSRYGATRVAVALDDFFGSLADAAVSAGVRRIVVGGGETSGAVVGALSLRSLRIGPEIAPGVPALASDGEPGLRLALKSGNFGGESFFADAMSVLRLS